WSFSGHASAAKHSDRQRPAAALLPRSSTMANPFVHVELHTKDLAKAKTFYGQLFGWQLQDTPMPGGGGAYTMIGVGEGTGGGAGNSRCCRSIPGALRFYSTGLCGTGFPVLGRILWARPCRAYGEGCCNAKRSIHS